MDEVFEQINFAAIKASSNIAKEKGSYSYFEGSDWQTGRYFEKEITIQNHGINLPMMLLQTECEMLIYWLLLRPAVQVLLQERQQD